MGVCAVGVGPRVGNRQRFGDVRGQILLLHEKRLQFSADFTQRRVGNFILLLVGRLDRFDGQRESAFAQSLSQFRFEPFAAVLFLELVAQRSYPDAYAIYRPLRVGRRQRIAEGNEKRSHRGSTLDITREHDADVGRRHRLP